MASMAGSTARSRRGCDEVVGEKTGHSGEKSVRLARKICVAGGSGKTNSDLLRPGAWAPLGSGSGRRSTRCVRAMHAWTCGWPRSCGLGWGVALAGLAHVGWPRGGAGPHGARGPTREELARGKRGCWAERGGGGRGGREGGRGGGADRDGPGRRGGLNSIFPFLSLFYLFQFDIMRE
jgi:hypothetical protein